MWAMVLVPRLLLIPTQVSSLWGHPQVALHLRLPKVTHGDLPLSLTGSLLWCFEVSSNSCVLLDLAPLELWKVRVLSRITFYPSETQKWLECLASLVWHQICFWSMILCLGQALNIQTLNHLCFESLVQTSSEGLGGPNLGSSFVQALNHNKAAAAAAAAFSLTFTLWSETIRGSTVWFFYNLYYETDRTHEIHPTKIRGNHWNIGLQSFNGPNLILEISQRSIYRNRHLNVIDIVI